MSLRYPGVCRVCGSSLAAGALAWDKRTDTRVLADHRIGSAAPVAHVAPKRVHTIRLNSGAVVSVNARGRCEDAPCCGCCS